MVNQATSAFLARLCAPELTSEAEDFFQRARSALNYKRKDLSLDINSPVAVLAARDFTLELAYALDEEEPASYLITRTLHSLGNAALIAVPEFDGLFAGGFSAIHFELVKGVSVEAVIDAVENLDDNAAMRVDYPSDCRDCTLRVAEVDAAVVCDGAALEMRFPRLGSPRELITAFGTVREAFALSKHQTLAGLLG